MLLIEKMTPFLDCFGRAFCYMPHVNQNKRGVLPLRDRQVRALLVYQFRDEHQAYPGRERVNEAVDFIEGRLLAKRTGPTVPTDCPILRCFLHAIEDDGSGSAEDIRKMLREVNQRSKLLKGTEKLPKNPTAMGKWLVKNQLILQAHGIEVFRPPRGSKKRLWDWQKFIRDDDTYDTSTDEMSQEASSPKPCNENENRISDTLSNEELAQLLKEVDS